MMRGGRICWTLTLKVHPAVPVETLNLPEVVKQGREYFPKTNKLALPDERQLVVMVEYGVEPLVMALGLLLQVEVTKAAKAN